LDKFAVVAMETKKPRNVSDKLLAKEERRKKNNNKKRSKHNMSPKLRLGDIIIGKFPK
jgi:hypothetical protein